VVIVELPYVSLHIAPDVPSIDEHIQSVTKILDDNGKYIYVHIYIYTKYRYMLYRFVYTVVCIWLYI
jgi:hypothetical protein